MKIFKLLIVTSLIISCGQNRGSQTKDPVLTSYMNQALSDVAQYGANTTFKETVDSWEFDDLEDKGLAGYCRHDTIHDPLNLTKTDVGRHIYINRKTWDNASDYAKKALILHEVLHCAWNAGHTDRGVMYPNFINIQQEHHYIYMIQDAANIIIKQGGVIIEGNNSRKSYR